MNEWTAWVERGSAFPITLQWMRTGAGSPLLLGLQQSWTGNGPFSLANWVNNQLWNKSTDLPESWSWCGNQCWTPKRVSSPSHSTSCCLSHHLLQGFSWTENQLGINSISSSTLSDTSFPLRHCHWALLWGKVKEGGETEPFLPGVEVDGEGMRPKWEAQNYIHSFRQGWIQGLSGPPSCLHFCCRGTILQVVVKHTISGLDTWVDLGQFLN